MTERIPPAPDLPASTVNSTALPPLSDERMDAIESRVLDRINAERTQTSKRGARRAWLGAGAAAAVVVAAALVAPAALSAIGGAGSTESYSLESADSAGSSESESADEYAPAPGTESIAGSAIMGDDGTKSLSPEMPDGRAIIANGSVTLLVDDAQNAADDLAARAEALGGYVESTDIDTTSQGDSTSYVTEGYAPDSMPYGGSNWVQIRIPADKLTQAIEDLSEVGEVTRSSVTRQDVTQTTIDLTAQVESAQASVTRLTELMNEAGSLADLIAAESALTERQWALQSAQQQLESLQSQVDMSSLSVTLTEESAPVAPDPAGFGDGFTAGWNGLLATINGIVIGLGFLIPWLAVLAIAGVIVWLIVRGVRRRRESRIHLTRTVGEDHHL